MKNGTPYCVSSGPKTLSIADPTVSRSHGMLYENIIGHREQDGQIATERTLLLLGHGYLRSATRSSIARSSRWSAFVTIATVQPVFIAYAAAIARLKDWWDASAR